MSEHNKKLKIKDVFESKNKISKITILDEDEKIYVVDINNKFKSIISTNSGSINHKEILTFVDDFIKETTTETTK